MSRYDATQTNESTRSAKVFKDLNLSFQQNSATKDIQKITDIEAVKRSVRNLINTNHYEKPFHPEIGSNIRAMLFENMTPQMNHLISKQIEKLITNYDFLVDFKHEMRINGRIITQKHRLIERLFQSITDQIKN